MREALAPFRAAFMLVARRRATYALLGLSIVILGISAWSSYATLSDIRRGAALEIERFGSSCFEEACRFIGPDGMPVGPAYRLRDFGSYERALDRLRDSPEMKTFLRERIAEAERQFAWTDLFVSRARMVGTFWGAFFAVAFAATFVGSEWRWSTWRTLMTHEPRRLRVLGGKLAALWAAIAAGAIVVMLGLVVLDIVLRAVYTVPAGGSVALATMGAEAGQAILGLLVYGSLAATLAVSTRSGVIAVSGALFFLLAEGLTTQRYTFLRVLVPHQQVSWLLPPTGSQVVVSQMWFAPLTRRVDCDPAGLCTEVVLPPIPAGRASVILAVWICGLAVLALAAIRFRDVPQ